jgi:hypothetical protein
MNNLIKGKINLALFYTTAVYKFSKLHIKTLKKNKVSIFLPTRLKQIDNALLTGYL